MRTARVLQGAYGQVVHGDRMLAGRPFDHALVGQADAGGAESVGAPVAAERARPQWIPTSASPAPSSRIVIRVGDPIVMRMRVT